MRYYVFEVTHSAQGEDRQTWGKDTRDEAIQLYHARMSNSMVAPAIYDALIVVVNSAGGVEMVDQWNRPSKALNISAFNATVSVTRANKALNAGDKIFPGDVLTISAVFDEACETTELMVNGVEFVSGQNFTVVNVCNISAMGYLPVEDEPVAEE